MWLPVQQWHPTAQLPKWQNKRQGQCQKNLETHRLHTHTNTGNTMTW